MFDLTAGLTAPEWRALIYFHRVDELGQSCAEYRRPRPPSPVRAVWGSRVRAAIACLVGLRSGGLVCGS
ncbi:MAG: hypothetical protein R2710_26660 [Acidimicrobiales bacterium]